MIYPRNKYRSVLFLEAKTTRTSAANMEAQTPSRYNLDDDIH